MEVGVEVGGSGSRTVYVGRILRDGKSKVRD